jgi:hypothetical protein
VIGGDGVERRAQIRAPSSFGEDAGGDEGGRVGLAGGDFLGRSRQSKTMERCHCFEVASSGSRKRPDHIFTDCCSFDIDFRDSSLISPEVPLSLSLLLALFSWAFRCLC